MTPEQREKALRLLSKYMDSDLDDNELIDAIAAIMAPQWLPVAGLVRDGRRISVGRWETVMGRPMWFFVDYSANDAQVDGFTHFCELPAALPGKPCRHCTDGSETVGDGTHGGT